MSEQAMDTDLDLSKALYKGFIERDWYLYANTVNWRTMDFIKNARGVHVSTKIDKDMILHIHGNDITIDRIIVKEGTIKFACHIGDPRFFNKLSIALDEF